MAFKGSFAWFDPESLVLDAPVQRELRERYPPGVEGAVEWQQILDSAAQQDVEGASGALRGLMDRDEVPVRRLFISHRQSDVEPARRVAKIAVDCGFEYWLDVEDPYLRELGDAADSPLRAVLIAAIIEVALLNSSHIIALITPNALSHEGRARVPSQKGPSLWIPYEYGRAKARTVVSPQAAAWVSRELSGPLPEYLHLGMKWRSESEIERWLLTTGGSETSPWIRAHTEATDPVIRGTQPLP